MSAAPACPVCGAALGAGGSCAHCDAGDDDLVAVYVAQGEVEAQMKRGLLEDAGIASMLAGEALRNAVGLTVDGLGAVRIVVRREDAARARCVLLGGEPDAAS